MMSFFPRACALAGLALMLPATAEDAVFYRCTAADGGLTIQNAACPPGSQQRIQRIAMPARTAPAATPAPAPAASPAPHDAAVPVPRPGVLAPGALPVLQAGPADDSGNGILDSDTLRRDAATASAADAAAPKAPLPPIFRCESTERGTYLHELEPAPPICLLMSVTGLGGGNTPVNAAGCEVVRDTCEAVPEPQRCASWQQRFRDARGRERFATADNHAAATAERERLHAVLAASDCAVPD
ncbi:MULTISPECIES: DUF4124 domain-containing protein [unclassified Stenotrophomonas]|uniref:DUF4124 domain-containing protein n=1 Tax=unclassified Stenotrophomonas TaxID=196198 RepID=UPI002915C86E|nr:DUF4124 domain-containing protein [Stenotrophomonas sp. Marseille-Q5258]